MPHNKVYGKRSRVNVTASIFQSPQKEAQQINILEITDKVESLTLQPQTQAVSVAADSSKSHANVLRPVANNARRTKQSTTRVDDLKVKPTTTKVENSIAVQNETATSQHESKSKQSRKRHGLSTPSKSAHQNVLSRSLAGPNGKLQIRSSWWPHHSLAKRSLTEADCDVETNSKEMSDLELENRSSSRSSSRSKTQSPSRPVCGQETEPLPRPDRASKTRSKSRPDEGSKDKKSSKATGRSCDRAVSFADDPSNNASVYETHLSALLPHSHHPILSFETWSTQLATHFRISKIAEASFGEVYRLSLLRPHPRLTKADESVLKIIALKPPPSTLPKRLSKAAKERLDYMSDPSDVASEVRLLQRMTCIPGFTNFRDVSIVQGRPGSVFANAWREWHEERLAGGKEGSVFPDPGKKASYSPQQLWAIIEMQDAGRDLENVVLPSVFAVWDVFWGVVLAIAKGEEAARFEHRDLHLGNICVSQRNKSAGMLGEEVDESKVDVARKLGFTGLETTIIDYTISRADMTGSSNRRKETSKSEAEVAYLDLANDQHIFAGDSTDEYQYDIYRYMRSALHFDDPLAASNDDEGTRRSWKDFQPMTNLVWLHFVLFKLLQAMTLPASTKGVAKFKGQEKERHVRKVQLESALRRVEEVLDLEHMAKSQIRSTGDLVALTLREGWLGVEDILGTATE